MRTITNPARERLSRDELAIGIGVRGVRGVEVASIMNTAGFDWLFIDLEHGATSVETAASICVAALSAGIAPLVRVPQGDLNLGTRCLDAGALGIVMPHVDTVEQAQAMVDAFRFAPQGHRSIAGNYAQLGQLRVELFRGFKSALKDEEADKLMVRLAGKHPENAGYLSARARILAGAGKFPEAYAFLSKAVERLEKVPAAIRLRPELIRARAADRATLVGLMARIAAQ